MNKSRTLLVTLIISNVVFALFALISYVGYTFTKARLEHEVFHLKEKNSHLKEHILQTNQGLNVSQFMRKHHITRELEDYEVYTNVLEYDLLYFQFDEHGILKGIE